MIRVICDLKFAITLMHSRHSWYMAGSFITMSTILQPWAGGLEYMALMIRVICDLKFATLLGSLRTMVRLPARSLYKPKFFENDCEQNSSNPSSKVSDGPGVSVETPRCETLVGAVEEGEEVLPLDQLRDLGPLLLGRVNPSWVVGAGMEDDHRMHGRSFKIFHHSFPVESLARFIPVPVLPQFSEAGILEDKAMISPGGVGVVAAFQTGDS